MNNTPDNQEPVEVENDEILTPAQSSTEVDDDDDDDDDDDAPDGLTELDALKIRAKTLGVTHSPNIGVETLKAKIEEHIAKLEAAREVSPPPIMSSGVNNSIPEPMKSQAQPTVNPASSRNALPPMHEMLKMTPDELHRFPDKRRQQIIRARMHHSQMALVRCQIFNNNPAKNDLQGEIFSVQNRYLGTVRKFIPYGEATENGYHIPRILLNMLLEKKYVQIKTVKDQKGFERVEKRSVPEFTIRELPPLTREELARLAATQAARASISSDGI